MFPISLFGALVVVIAVSVLVTSCAPATPRDRDEIASDIASEFLYAFNTYDARTLADGSYLDSWVDLVSINDDTTDLLRQRMSEEWIEKGSAYPALLSECTSVDVECVHVCDIMYDDTLQASATCVINENQANPGEMEWEYVNTNRVEFLVFFDDSLKIFDVRRVYAQTLAFDVTGLDM